MDLTKKATPFAILHEDSRASFAAECGGEYDMSMRSVALARRSTAAYFETIGETGPGGRPKNKCFVFRRPGRPSPPAGPTDFREEGVGDGEPVHQHPRVLADLPAERRHPAPDGA